MLLTIANHESNKYGKEAQEKETARFRTDGLDRRWDWLTCAGLVGWGDIANAIHNKLMSVAGMNLVTETVLALE